MLTVSRGLASPRTREFRAGEPQDAASVGTSGDWQLRGPGVEPIHAYLYFDGESIYVQSALDGQELISGGGPVGNDWVAVAVADVIEIGTARITLSQIHGSQTGASAVSPRQLGASPPVVFAPDGSDAITGEERTAFLPLASLESRVAPAQLASDEEEEEATRYPGVPSPSYGNDDDEATRMVSLEVKAPPVPAPSAPVVATPPDSEPETELDGDPYDDLQERTIAASGLAGAERASAIVPYRADTAVPNTPTGPVGALPPIQAYGSKSPVPPARASEPRSARPSQPRATAIPQSHPTPEPRAGWSGAVLPSDASRARASAEILGSQPRLDPQPKAPSAATKKPDLGTPGPSIGEMTRVAPLSSDAEAARQFAISQATTVSKRRAAEAAAAAAAGGPNDGMTRPRSQGDSSEEGRRRKQKTAVVRNGPDGSGAYSPPPPPKALPQAQKPATKSSPSALRKGFDSFALHFEEVNGVRKTLYLLLPLALMGALYIVFGPEPPLETGPAIQPPAPSVVEPPPVAPTPGPSTTEPTGPLPRPDGDVVKVDPTALPDPPPVAKGGKDKTVVKVTTTERKAADAYAAGQYDRAILLYRELLAAPDLDPSRQPGLAEVLRIVELKKASGKQETLQQAEPPPSAR